MKVKGVIDSLNFSSEHLENYFEDRNMYFIETVKGIGVFEPQVWTQTFKKSLQKHIVEAKILHTFNGLQLPIKRFSSSKLKQTIEFAGLHGYIEKSSFMCEILKNLWGQIQAEVITRIDIAIDFKKAIPKNVLKRVKTSRRTFPCKNTTYFKTQTEKSTNPYIDIKIYDKAKHANLKYELQRLEFCFKGGYFRKKYTIEMLDEIIPKLQKTIKRMSGLDVEIEAFKFSL
ncbi:MAG: hypothetical protein QM497_05290 [Sulfurimonas sp.]